MEESVTVEITVKAEPLDYEDSEQHNDDGNDKSPNLTHEEIWIKPENQDDETEESQPDDGKITIKIESKESGESSQSCNVSEMSEDITQRNARYCKKYYYRKKSANQGVVKKKTNSEKCRQYRQRKKLLAQQLQSTNEVIHTPSTSSLQMTFEPQLITTDDKNKSWLPLKKRLDKEVKSDGDGDGEIKQESGEKEAEEDAKQPTEQPPKSMETPVMYSYDITKNIEIVTISEEERQLEYEETKKSRQHMRHVCEHCALGFVLKQAYLMHMKVHSPESGEHECVLCHTRMKTADMLYRHRLRHYRRYRCLLCWTRFKDKDTAACHVMNDHAQQTFECEHCGKGFKRPQYLKRHVEQHHTKPLNLECSVCLRVFHERGWYRTHIRSHNEEIRAMTVKVPVSCAICSREFKTKEGLKRHLLTHENEDVACDLCGVKCKNRNTLAQHFLKVHNEKYEGAPEQTCPECMRVCATRVILKRHIKRMHSDRTKKYQCDHCQRMYLTKAEVRSHIAWSHLSGEARGGHACACGRVFRSPSLLRDHTARAHAALPPPRLHQCDICEKAFANKQVLNRHRKGHSNEMYPCNECGLLFKTQPYVKVHYQIKHLNMTRAEIKEQRKLNKNKIPQNNIHKSVSPEPLVPIPGSEDQSKDPLMMEVEVKLETEDQLAPDSVETE